MLFCDLFVHPYWTNLHGTCNQTSTWFQVTVATANWGAHAVLSSARVLPGGHRRLPALCLAVSTCVVNWEDITDFLLFVLSWVSVLLTGRHHRLPALCLAVSIWIVYLEDIRLPALCLAMSVSFTGRTSQTCWPLSCCEYLCCLPGGRHKHAALCLAVSICVIYLEDVADLLFVLPWVSMSFTWRMLQTFCSLSCHEYLCRLPGGDHRLSALVLLWVFVLFTWMTSQTFCSLSCCEYRCCLPGGHHRFPTLCLAVSICLGSARIYLEDRLPALCLAVSICVGSPHPLVHSYMPDVLEDNNT